MPPLTWNSPFTWNSGSQASTKFRMESWLSGLRLAGKDLDPIGQQMFYFQYIRKFAPSMLQAEKSVIRIPLVIAV